MIRQLSSAGSCKYLHNYDKKLVLNFCKQTNKQTKIRVLINIFTNKCQAYSSDISFEMLN